MIKNIIFDIGNVLMTFQPFTYYESMFQDKKLASQVCAIFSHEAWIRYDQGLITIQDLTKVFHTVYPNLIDELNLVLNDWPRLLQPIQEMIEFKKKLQKKGYHVYLLSNINVEGVMYLQSLPFFQECDGSVLSCEEHLVKPDPKLYETLLGRFALSAKECLFIDDRSENVETAISLGMKGIVCDTVEQVKRDTEKLLGEYYA